MAKSDSTGLILLAVGGAAAYYYAYTQGWLSSITSLFGSAATPAPAASAPAVSTTTVPPTVVSAPATPAAPVTTVTKPSPSPSQSILLAPLQAVASQPGNVALSPSGGQTYSGWQWDAIAKSALGPGYQPLSLLPTLQGGTQYTIQQYLAAYPTTGGVSGLGRTVLYFPRRGASVTLGRNYHMRRA